LTGKKLKDKVRNFCFKRDKKGEREFTIGEKTASGTVQKPEEGERGEIDILYRVSHAFRRGLKK